jgi:transposase|tara:strand:- start:580 stop:960 length:381 start_codon:yes stop_codon:yes gene_type:complete
MAHSNDLRIRAVEYFNRSNLSYGKVALIFGIGVATLYRWVQRHKKTGTVQKIKAPGRVPMIGPENFPQLKSFVLENADNSLYVLSEKWAEKYGPKLSISTFSRTIAKTGLTYKKNFSCDRTRYGEK